MRRITIKRGRTWHYGKMRRYIEQSNALAPLSRFQSWLACTINTSGYDFQKGQRNVGSSRSCKDNIQWVSSSAAEVSVSWRPLQRIQPLPGPISAGPNDKERYDKEGRFYSLIATLGSLALTAVLRSLGLTPYFFAQRSKLGGRYPGSWRQRLKTEASIVSLIVFTT